jgi:hypothetical protein
LSFEIKTVNIKLNCIIVVKSFFLEIILHPSNVR